jgi:hypothetical protein
MAYAPLINCPPGAKNKVPTELATRYPTGSLLNHATLPNGKAVVLTLEGQVFETTA